MIPLRRPQPMPAALYARADDTTWPLPGETEWMLRYAPEGANRLHAASLAAAYTFLTDPTITQTAAIESLKRARRAVSSGA